MEMKNLEKNVKELLKMVSNPNVVIDAICEVLKEKCDYYVEGTFLSDTYIFDGNNGAYRIDQEMVIKLVYDEYCKQM